MLSCLSNQVLASAARVMMVLASAAAASGSSLAADIPTNDPAPVAVPVRVDRMVSGRAAVKASDWKKAIAELTAAVKEQPANADAHNLLAYSYRKQPTPDLPKAFEHYHTALKLNPSHQGAHEYIGEAYLMDKQPAKAEEHLARLQTICGGPGCEAYDDLAKSVAAYKAKNK